MKKLLGTGIKIKSVVVNVVKAFFILLLVLILAIYLPCVVSAPEVSRQYKENFSHSNLISDTLSGDRALFMPTSYESFYRRLVMVKNAEQEIVFTTHNSVIDDGGKYFYAALLEAADRGVKVQVLTDGIVNLFFRSDEGNSIYRLLSSHENIQMYMYNEINFLRPDLSMFRLHDKFMTVDDKMVILGGANLGYSGFVKNVDAEVLVTQCEGVPNSAVVQANNYFNELINCNLTVCKKERASASDKKYKEQIIQKFNDYYYSGCKQDENYSTGKLSGYNQNPDYTKIGYEVNKITLCVNPIDGNKRAGNILHTILDCGKNSNQMRVQTPYFVFSDNVEKEFINLAKNTDLKIQTNSLYNTANIAIAHYLGNRRTLAQDLNFYEYQGDLQVHAKVITYDNNLSIVGSFNFDERSAFLDTEAVFAICGEEFNASVQQFLDGLMNESLHVNENNEYDISETVSPKEANVGKKLIYAIMQFICPPFECLL